MASKSEQSKHTIHKVNFTGNNKRNLTIIVIVVLLAIISGISIFYQYQKAQQKLKNPNAAAQEEIKITVNKVENLVELPQDETPTLATVTDRSKLNENAFFENALNGDKVLIYAQAKKAILYRPSTNKLVNITTLQASNQDNKPSATSLETTPVNNPKPSPLITDAPLNIVIFNGAKVSGAARRYQQILNTKLDFVKVTNTLTAEKNNYPETIVFDQSKKIRQTNLNKILKEVNGKIVNSLSENVPKGTDVIIVIGSNSATLSPSQKPSPTP